jgi:hypothetical protein
MAPTRKVDHPVEIDRYAAMLTIEEEGIATFLHPPKSDLH